MEKSQLIKVFKLNNLLAGFFITLIIIAILLMTDSSETKYLYYGIILGAWTGIIINYFIAIPKIFKKKDERELIIMILSMALTLTIALMCALLAFIMVASNTIQLDDHSLVYPVYIIFSIALMVKFVSQKLMNTFL